jgi:hypothetical protein
VELGRKGGRRRAVADGELVEGERRQRETLALVGVGWAEERNEGVGSKMRGTMTDMWAHEWVVGVKKKYEG